MSLVPFNPSWVGTFYIPNAVAASTPVALSGGPQVVLYNSSASATAFVRVSNLTSVTATGDGATVPGLAAAPGSFPIPPLAQIRITVGAGHKSISAIATAADGNLYVTPGQGD